MPSFIQYHNAEKMGWLPLDGLPFLRTSLLIYTSRPAVRQAVGSTVYLVVGLGRPRRYYLWECFRVEEVREDKARYFAEGTGWQLAPPQRLEGKEFDAFRLACASFIGFQNIDASPYLPTLEALARRYHCATFDDEVIRFCDDLVASMPSSGDIRFTRGFVHQRMGNDDLALADCVESLRLGTEFAAEAEALREEIRRTND
jgi:hypothetical protein